MLSPEFFDVAYSDAGFRLLVVVVAALLNVALVFAAGATLLRGVTKTRQHRRARQHGTWMPLLQDVQRGRCSPTALQAAVRPTETLSFLKFLSAQAPGADAGQLGTLRLLAEPFLPAAVRSVDARALEVRARRIEMLGWLGGSSYDQVLLDALHDSSPLVVIVALRALVRRGNPQHVEPIVEHLPRYRAWSQQGVAGLLAELGPEAARALRRTLADARQSKRTRLIAAAALQRLQDDLAADVAASLLEREVDHDLATALLRLLARTARDEHLPLLRRLARADDEVLRIRAFSTLTSLGAADTATLERALHDPSRWVAIQAARGLVQIDRHDVLAHLARSEAHRAPLARQILAESPVAA